MKRWAATLLVLFLAVDACGAEEVFDPIRYGAKPDGRTLATAAIQEAIDACAAAGGGVVRLSPGKYLSGTIFFRSGVTLQVDEGATLLGSTNLNDYPHKTPAFWTMTDQKQQVTQTLIYAEGVEKIALRGKGVIDGQGASFTHVKEGPCLVNRPFLIRMSECRDVLVEDVTLRNSASWTEYYVACDRLTIRGIKVIGHVMRNNDGIDIDGCQDVHISNVETTSDDDGMCFKGCSLRPTKNVVVENCRFFSYCNSLKYGTDSQGGLENVQIRNVQLGQPAPGTPPKMLGAQEGISGIALEIVDSGTMQNVSIDNVQIRGTRAPIYLVLGDRGRHLKDQPRLPPGVLRNVTISNVQAEAATNLGCPILGLPGHPIEGLTLRNLTISFPGGGLEKDTVRQFDEIADTYPEAIKYAERLPAFGLFCWHVKGLTLDNVQLTTRQPEGRPAIVLEDASDVTIDNRPLDRDHPPAGVRCVPAAADSPPLGSR